MKNEKQPITRKENSIITYKFSEDELKQKAKELAQACHDKEQIENEKKEAMSSFKYKIDGKDSQIGILSNQISNGYEMRNVTCEVEFDFETGYKSYYYEGVFYDKVKMKKEDYQLEAELK